MEGLIPLKRCYRSRPENMPSAQDCSRGMLCDWPSLLKVGSKAHLTPPESKAMSHGSREIAWEFHRCSDILVKFLGQGLYVPKRIQLEVPI